MSSGSGYHINLGDSVGVDLDVIFKSRLSTTTYNVPPTNYTVNEVDISGRYEPLYPYQANSNGTSFKTPITTGYKLTNGSDLNTIFCRADYPEIVLNGSGVLTADIVNTSLASVSTPVVIVIEGYTSIDEGAFLYNTYIIQVTIPNTVTSLGSVDNDYVGPFYGCSHLSTVIFESGSQLTFIDITTFFMCTNLVSIKIPSTVTYLGGGAFRLCSSLTSIIIPESVEYIGSYIFADSTQLLYVIFEGNSNISKQTFDNATPIFPGSTSLTTVYCTLNTLTNWGLTAGPNQTISGSNPLNIIEYDVLLSGTGTLTYGTVPYLASGSVILIDGYTSIGQSAFNNTSVVGWVIILNSVTSIGQNAFQNYYELTEISIPNSVTSIGDYAFNSCSSLTSINIPNSVTSIGQYAFASCYELTEISIPISVTSIGQYAFAACENLTEITIGTSVTSISDYAFVSCYRLREISIPISVTSIGQYAFYNSGFTSITFEAGSQLASIGNYAFAISVPGGVTIPDLAIPSSVTYIGQYAFDGCSSLTSITFEENSQLTSIGQYALVESLTSITFEAGSQLTSIGQNAFLNFALREISIPNSVTSIGDYAFQSCFSLTSITFENGSYLQTIGLWAFYDCFSLTEISIPDSVTSIGQSAFYGTQLPITYSTYLQYILLYVPSNTTSITIYDSVTSIGDYAFNNCSSLTSINIPNSVSYIGQYAFNNCSSLTSINIPNSVTSIGQSAFQNCSSLTSIALGQSTQLTYIGQNAFYGCSNLQLITIPDSVTYIGDYAFYDSGITNVTMSPKNSLEIDVDVPSNITIGQKYVTVRQSYQITYFRQATYQSESNKEIYRIVFNGVDDTTFNTIQTTLIGMNEQDLNGQYLTITYVNFENNIQFIYSGTLTLNNYNVDNNPIYKGSSVSNTVAFIFNSTPILTNVNGIGYVLTSTETYSEYYGGSSSTVVNTIIPTSFGGHVYISY